MTPNPNDFPLAERETEERIAKLRLEQTILRQQMSTATRMLEWLKAATAPVALIALFWTVISGFDQMKQTRKAAIDDRFDKSISRIAGTDAYQRVTGVAGLRQFLSGSSTVSRFSLISDYNRQPDAVAYLATALAVEKDPVIRDAILDVLSELQSIGVSANIISDGLRIEVERNRKLARSVDLGKDSLEALPTSDPRIAQLHATAMAIVTLVRQGAHLTNMSDVYCVECDFSGSVDLSRTTFDRSILRGSDFSHAHLESASFDGADILGARFVGTDLHSARFTDFYHSEEQNGRVPRTPPLVRLYQVNTELEPVDFSHADLTGASFAKQIMFGIFEDYGPEYSTSWSYNFANANLDQADLSDIKIFVRFSLPKSVSEDQLLDPKLNTAEELLPFVLEDGFLLDNDRLSPTDARDDPQAPKRTRDYFLVMNVGPHWRAKQELRVFRNSLQAIAGRLGEALNVPKAHLPPGLRTYIRSSGQGSAHR